MEGEAREEGREVGKARVKLGKEKDDRGRTEDKDRREDMYSS
jgi:hypothetical protein